jgi:hypothetical protein
MIELTHAAQNVECQRPAARDRAPLLRFATVVLAGFVSVGCGQSGELKRASTATAANATPTTVAVGTSTTGSATTASASAPTTAVATASAAATATPPAGPLEGALFTDAAKRLARASACSTDGTVPNGMDALVDAHCKNMQPIYDSYRKGWMEVAIPYLAKLRPKTLPTKVVYPFGGGDLLTALATYPDAEEFTIMSLETAGDVRGIDRANKGQLNSSLRMLREHLARLFDKVHSRTVNLWLEASAVLPGEITFSLAALALHGAKVESLRYFEIKDDGSLRYMTDADVANADAAKGSKKIHPTFHHVEIRFLQAGGPVRVARHISANLDNEHLEKQPGLLQHLKAKGPFAAMTKAASHLLWSDLFSTIRDLLFGQMTWMVSDTTCAPPRLATKAGFVQDTYGTYLGAEPFGLVNNNDIAAFIKLFKDKPQQELPFRYGYPDNKSHGHMVITRKP